MGKITLELSSDLDLLGKKIVIIDDVLATGGILFLAIIKLLTRLDASVCGLSFFN